MKLNVLERIVAIAILSDYKEGNFITFKTIDSLKSKLFVTEKEVKEFDLRIEDGNYHWNEKGNEEIDIEITDGENKLIKDGLLQLDKESRLTRNHLTLYEKVIE